MTFLYFKKIAKRSGLRAVLLGAMGLVTLLFPEFLKGSIIYAVAAYAILHGALGILDFLSGRDRKEKHIAYLNLFAAAAAILFGILSMVLIAGSYDDHQFSWASDVLISGDIENVRNGNGVFVDYGYSQEFNWEIGDLITLDINGTTHEAAVSGIVSDVPLDSSNGKWIIVCSENTFTVLTGITDYKIIEVQASTEISEQIRNLITSDMKLLDMRQHNEEVRTGYFAMAVFVYGFLIVIALVALINMINTVNASVSSRINHYGVMRAVGMSGKQMQKVIRAEAAAYAVTGSIAGAISGLFLHRFFFEMLLTSNWGQ